jgi:ferredoxin
MSHPPLVPPEKVWSHSPRADRDETAAYRLPANEVLPFLMARTSFVETTSSPANDEARRVIHEQQYPHLHGPTAPLGTRRDWTPTDVEREVAAFVNRYAGVHLESRAVRIGYTPVLPVHVYADGDLALPHAVVLGLPMRYEETNAAPEPRAGEEVTRNYMELGGLTLALGRWLRDHGYAAEAHHPRGDADLRCEALFIPHAIAAGFGELGRHGSMISRESGPRVRLSLVTTDAPIPEARQEPLGIAEFCTWCTRCLTACPVDAIPRQRTLLRGSYRYIVDTSACLPYFAETDGCGICIAVCPYNRASAEDSTAFVERVRGLDWVRRGAEIAGAEGVEAMERYVERRRAAQHRRGAPRGRGWHGSTC